MVKVEGKMGAADKRISLVVVILFGGTQVSRAAEEM